MNKKMKPKIKKRKMITAFQMNMNQTKKRKVITIEIIMKIDILMI